MGLFKKGWRLVQQFLQSETAHEGAQDSRESGGVDHDDRSAAATQQSGKRGGRRQKAQPAAVIIVGCDFGTHSTKVLYQRRSRGVGEQAIYRPEIAKPCRNYPTCAVPSAVRLVDGRLLFGADAIQGKGGELFQSLKLGLLMHDPKHPLHESAATSEVVLSVAYLAWIFRRVVDHVRKDFERADIRFQLPVPLDALAQGRSDQLREIFLRVVQAAWRISVATEPNPIRAEFNGHPDLSRVEGEIKRLLADPLIEEGERLFDVLPEAIAPIVTLSKDPDREPGVHLLVDMGAATTEISVIDIRPVAEEDVISCYFNTSIEIGAIKLAAEERSHATQLQDLIRQVDDHCTQVHYRGYDKVKGNHGARRHWRDVTVVLTGGGTLRPDVRKIFETLPNGKFQGYLRQFSIEQYLVDGGGVDIGMVSPHIAAGESRFLVGARGLLLERPNWPIWFAPGEIAPMAATQETEAIRPHWEQ